MDITPLLVAMTLAVVATSALTPATNHALRVGPGVFPSCQLEPPRALYIAQMTRVQYLDRQCYKTRLVSADGKSALSLGPFGTLVLLRLDTGSQLWAASPVIPKLVMQDDGNPVGYKLVRSPQLQDFVDYVGESVPEADARKILDENAVALLGEFISFPVQRSTATAD